LINSPGLSPLLYELPDERLDQTPAPTPSPITIDNILFPWQPTSSITHKMNSTFLSEINKWAFQSTNDPNHFFKAFCLPI